MKASLAATLILAASAAQAEWAASDNVALANPGDPVVVGISFDYTEQCKTAQLIIAGNSDITSMGLVVDSTDYGHVEAYNAGNGLMMATAGPAALRALKHGNKAAVVTDQGSLVFGLTGSANAMDIAYAGCLVRVDQILSEFLKPLEPSAANVPAGSVNF